MPKWCTGWSRKTTSLSREAGLFLVWKTIRTETGEKKDRLFQAGEEQFVKDESYHYIYTGINQCVWNGWARGYRGAQIAPTIHKGAWRIGRQNPWGWLGSHQAGEGPKSMGIVDLDHWQGPKGVVGNGRSWDVDEHRPKTMHAILSVLYIAAAFGG